MEITSKEMEVRPNTISDLKVDASFRKISKNAICFHIWRIDEDRLEAVVKSQYGTFHDDAAYIIYAANTHGTHVNQDTITRETKNGTNLERFIHFWLGEKVSEQKRSNVAHKIQELDSYFGNVSTEYRETQDNESARFLSYFKRGIIIRSGAQVLNSSPNRLFQLRGRKWLRCIEMEEISWSNFASNYIMLLQIDEQLFIWIGRSSSAIERRDAIELATARWPPGNQKVAGTQYTITIVDDGYEQSMPEASKTIWNAHLPLSQRVVSQTVPSMPERQHTGKLKIYKCAYRANRLHLDQMDVVMPTRDDLSDSTTVYVLDAHGEAVWLWVGKETKQQESIGAMGNGRAFVKKKKYPYCTPVVRVVEGHEPVEFTRLFPNWHSDWHNEHSNHSIKSKSTANLGRFDSLTLSQRPKMAASTQLIDDGSGERTIYRITKDQVIEMPPTKIIMFCTHNAYVVRYLVAMPSTNASDAQNTGVKSIIYQWNGSEASADVVSKCERFAKATFEEEEQQHQSMFVQMSEFDETPHFLQLFEGKLIILQNDRHLQYANNNNSNGLNGHIIDQINADQHFVLKICGDATYNSKAVEVYPVSAMSSKECYVVRANHVWVWCGQSSTGDAREVAKNVGALLGESFLVLEGKEPKDFWRSVANLINQPQTQQPLLTANGSLCSSNSSSSSSSGHGSASSNGNSPSSSHSITGYLGNQLNTKSRPKAQLFLVWAQRGTFSCAEIMAYEQCDLAPECVYILDAGMITYIWLGTHACTYEKEKYFKMVQHYLDTNVPLARRPTTAIAVIRQSSEPNVFKGFFEQWNCDFWKNFMSYDKRRQMLMQPMISGISSNSLAHSNGNTMNSNSTLPPALLNNHKDFDRHHKYPINMLQQETDLLPVEVNPLKREVHLTHDDFVSVFNMSFWEFDELPGWKKQELKKKYKLF